MSYNAYRGGLGPHEDFFLVLILVLKLEFLEKISDFFLRILT